MYPEKGNSDAANIGSVGAQAINIDPSTFSDRDMMMVYSSPTASMMYLTINTSIDTISAVNVSKGAVSLVASLNCASK
eukprot:CAMPEP_0114315860 /NCGR_PEP_ID=MMETSP0059-20121206/22833_1 /TAXON_ID=36894 /ORGANISM="Pyramimonas parkeae, Strain CCMP726" /LENGTH=77 /DNA_ID=CAMNT_0001441629 /DNA_START=417 /DNA_END=650 /DNA_ORIENTATION=+